MRPSSSLHRLAGLSALALCSAVFAQQPPGLPTHCVKGEYAYLNAHMSEIRRPPEGGDTLVRTGKLLSVCADGRSEPFRRVAYRFGPEGKVEMESVASDARPFHVFDRSTSPHTGENVMFFKVGGYTYCVIEATAQGSGVGLRVIRSGRQVLDLFSGNRRGVDFESEMIDVNFVAPRSSVLRSYLPADPFETPCDPKVRK